MKSPLRWLALVGVFVALMTSLTGCSLIMTVEPIYSKPKKQLDAPVFTDEIVAVGRADAATDKEIEQTNAVAFIGRKHTYMLYKGGEELVKISQLKLDGKRMNIDTGKGISLYQKDKQIWGELALTYSADAAVSTQEQGELDKGGFTTLKDMGDNQYQKKVGVEGLIYPATYPSDKQLSILATPQTLNLYTPPDSTPANMSKICFASMVALGAGSIDSALFSVPVGLIGGAAVLVSGVSSVVNGTWPDDQDLMCW